MFTEEEIELFIGSQDGLVKLMVRFTQDIEDIKNETAKISKLEEKVNSIEACIKEHKDEKRNFWPKTLQGWLYTAVAIIIVMGGSIFGAYEAMRTVDVKQQQSIDRQHVENAQLKSAISRIEKKLDSR